MSVQASDWLFDDDLDLTRLDPAGMLATVESTPRMWAEALEIATSAQPPPPGEHRTVVVAGMGGSGIAADVAAIASRHGGRVPVLAAKGYDLPAIVGPDVLVVLVSYSGDTEETLSCLEQASAAGASLYAVTSGGQLAKRAEADGFPAVRIPGGGQPRANLPYLVTPVLLGLERAGLLGGLHGQLAGLAGHLDGLLEDWGHATPTARNPVKGLALALHRLVPVFYGGAGWPAVAALRAKCQVNENAKRPAFHHELPELDHNEIVGWSGPEWSGEPFGVVELRSPPDEHPRVGLRFDATRQVVGGKVGRWRAVEAVGTDPLARFASAVLFVDLLSVYLAFLEGQDPTPVEAISTIKRRLTQ